MLTFASMEVRNKVQYLQQNKLSALEDMSRSAFLELLIQKIGDGAAQKRSMLSEESQQQTCDTSGISHCYIMIIFQ